jgi:mannose-6-phosphate isomerase
LLSANGALRQLCCGVAELFDSKLDNVMAIELARAHAVPKLWGAADLRPFSSESIDGDGIGEIWFERASATSENTTLLLKLIFTTQPLSIQVHPNDAYAHSIGLPSGKTEAWYVLSASPGAKIALGLKQHLTAQQFKLAVDDGSIEALVDWRPVASGETISVPAGTIHAIGTGLVIAEVQQRSDSTFRLFDFGRGRELHVEHAIAVANKGPARDRTVPVQLSETRSLLTSNSHFIFEKITLAAASTWRLKAERETWCLVVNGSARIGGFEIGTGEAISAQRDFIDIHVGTGGLQALLAYTGAVAGPEFLQRSEHLVAAGQ